MILATNLDVDRALLNWPPNCGLIADNPELIEQAKSVYRTSSQVIGPTSPGTSFYQVLVFSLPPNHFDSLT